MTIADSVACFAVSDVHAKARVIKVGRVMCPVLLDRIPNR